MIHLAEKGLVPTPLIRWGIRQRLGRRLAHEAVNGSSVSLEPFLKELRASPIAIETSTANEQHYELPSEYFSLVLGPRRKYSGCYWPAGVENLAEAEEAMLRLTAERAQLADGQEVLELGCGWGSFCLWAAERYPTSRITAVSNSRTQRAFIEEQARQRALTNLQVLTADMNHFQPPGTYDRIVSIEMFEHMRNYQELLRRIRGWLKAEGRLFVHIFTNRRYAYPFEVAGQGQDWMARYFFSGGTMPSDDLLLHFQDDLTIDGHWRVNGVHYSRTLEAWLAVHDARKSDILPIFRRVYGEDALVWFHRWRLFYLACSELFRYHQGEEWLVSHYRFRRD